MDLPIFLVSGNAHGAAVRAEVARWAAVGLARRTVWVSSSELADDDPTSVGCTIVDDEGERDADLLMLLGADELTLVRLVALNLLPTAGDVDPELPVAARRLEDHLRFVLPSSTQLRPINVVVPASRVSGVDPELLQRGWSSNLVLSPEDRASERHTDVFVRPSNFTGHAALGSMVIGAAWRSMAVGRFDDVTGSSQGATPVVVRCFGRVVEGTPVVDAIAESVLVNRDDWPLPHFATGRPVGAPNPKRVIDEVLRSCKDYKEGVFRFRPEPEPSLPPPQPVGILAAFVEMFRFIARGIRRMPQQLKDQLYNEAVKRAESLAQGLTYGRDSQMVVRLGARELDRTPTEQPPTFGPDIGEAVSEAEWVLDQFEDPPMAAPVPDIWETLRGISFGLVDGADLPSGFETPKASGNRAVVTSPRLIAPDPAGPPFRLPAHVSSALFDVNEEIVVRTCDPYAVRILRDRIQRELDGTQEEGKTAEEAAPVLHRDLLSEVKAGGPAAAATGPVHAAGPSAEPQEDDVDWTEDQEATAPASSDEGDANTPDGAVSEGPGADDAAAATIPQEELESILEAMDGWVKQRSGAFWWQLSDRVAGSATKALLTLIDAVSILLRGPTRFDGKAEYEARKKLRRRWILFGVLAVLLVAGAIVLGPVMAVIGGSLVASMVAAGLVAWVGGWFWSFVKYQRTLFRLRHRAERGVGEFEHAWAQAQRAAVEASRLGSLYQQMVDWADVVGWVVHHPWSRSSIAVQAAAGPSSLGAEGLPAAMSVAVAEAPDERLHTLGVRYGRRIFDRAWLHELYEQLLAQQTARFCSTNALELDSPQADPDVDTPQVPNGARAHLLEGLASGDAQGSLLDATLADIAEFCREQPPEDIFEDAEPLDGARSQAENPDALGAYLQRIVPTGDEMILSRAGFSSTGVIGDSHAVKATSVWVPGFLLADAAAAGGEVRELPVHVAAGEPYLLNAVRVDVTVPQLPEHLGVFSEEDIDIDDLVEEAPTGGPSGI